MSNAVAFAWVCLAVELTPGPNMTYLAVLTLAEGRRAGFAAVAGVALGLGIVGLLSAAGVGAVVSASPFLYELLRIAGTAYLLWLAYETWRGLPGDVAGAAGDRVIQARAFRDGLVTNLLNPKAAVFYIAVLPVFVDKSAPVLPQTLGLAAIYVAIATAVHITIVLLASRAKPLIEAAGNQQQVRTGFAVMIVAIALWMVWVTRR